jgi:TatD DNase family protein
MIDTHCHLSFPDYNGDRAAVIQRAADVGVVGFVSVATEPEDWYRTLDIAEMYPAMRVAVGVHPNHAQVYSPAVAEELRKTATHARVVGIGETGLDFYRETAPRDKQFESFRTHLTVAAERNLPFILHCRNAENEMLQELTAERTRIGRPLRGVWHCFTAGVEHARRAIELDLYFGLGGIVTFQKSTAIREAIALLPENRLLLETDCPFLSPQGFRNQRRNEPSFLTSVVTTLSEVRQTTPDEIRRITTENARALFGTW